MKEIPAGSELLGLLVFFALPLWLALTIQARRDRARPADRLDALLAFVLVIVPARLSRRRRHLIDEWLTTPDGRRTWASFTSRKAA